MNDYELELAEEARRDEMHEHNMRNNFDYFLDYIGDDIQELQDAISNVMDKYSSNGWEFDIDEVREI